MDSREPARIRDGGTIVTNSHGDGLARIAACRHIVAEHQYAKIDGLMVDLFTASAIVKVYDALNEANRAKFERLSIAHMATVSFDVLH
jgi:hypothetical protein